MNLNPYELSLISGGFTLLGGLITYRFALVLTKKQAKRNCGRKLIEAFSPELATLNPNLKIYPGEIKKILLDAFPKHRAAMIEYGFHLSGREKTNFGQLRNKYFENVTSDNLFSKYLNETGSQLFHEDINALIKETEI